MNLDAIQSALRDQHLDGWLFYDHHHRDPLAYSILGLDPKGTEAVVPRAAGPLLAATEALSAARR